MIKLLKYLHGFFIYHLEKVNNEPFSFFQHLPLKDRTLVTSKLSPIGGGASSGSAVGGSNSGMPVSSPESR
jgi:hypothetical protein